MYECVFEIDFCGYHYQAIGGEIQQEYCYKVINKAEKNSQYGFEFLKRSEYHLYTTHIPGERHRM